MKTSLVCGFFAVAVGLNILAPTNVFIQPAFAEAPSRCHIDWTKLNLSPQQNQQIQALEAAWIKEYQELAPAIQEDQKRLAQLLADRQADPVEVMAVQQSIAQKKEKLHNEALKNFLKKKQILNDNQKQQLEFMLKQSIEERQKQLNSSNDQVMPERIQNLMQKVRNIWPIQQDK